MALTTAGRNALLDSGKTVFTHVSAYYDLGTTEAATTRQAITWTASASGVTDNSAQLLVPIPAHPTNAVVCFTVHSAVSAGTLYGIGQIGSIVRGVATVSTADLFTSVAHGLTTDDRVFFSTASTDTIPTGISTTTLYFVLASGLTADAFKVSTTSGGAALDVTAAGECSFFKTVPNVFASAGNLTFAAGALDFVGTEI